MRKRGLELNYFLIFAFFIFMSQAAFGKPLTVSELTLDQKIGQLIVPAIRTTDLSEPSPEIIKNIKKYGVGGYHLLIDPKHLQNPLKTTQLLNQMQSLSEIPLLISADLEGGAGFYYKGLTRFPRAMALGATDNPEMVRKLAEITAKEALGMGIHVNFYPDVDVNSNPKNPIINIRSFGSQPDLVSLLACAYIEGYQDAGGVAVAKHFPGHGDTSIDSHMELPKLDVSYAKLSSLELLPFKAAVQHKVDGVMSAHILLPLIETELVPATLSNRILTGILRQELGFDGLVYTDALMMKGISAHYKDAEAAVRAVQAGADLLLFPQDVPAAYGALKAAVRSGEITEARINESVGRILKLKNKLNLPQKKQVYLTALKSQLHSKSNSDFAQEVMNASITLLNSEERLFPLHLKPKDKVLVLTIMDKAEGWRETKPGKHFVDELKERHSNTVAFFFGAKYSNRVLNELKHNLPSADYVIVNSFTRVSAFKGSIDLSSKQLDLVREIMKSGKKVILVAYGNPYIVGALPEPTATLLTFEYCPSAEHAVLKGLLGEYKFTGRLPIDIPEMYGFGHSASKPRSYRSNQLKN